LTKFSPNRLRHAREAAGLTHEQLAVILDVTSFSTREWERGRITPRTNVVGRLADALAVPVDALFSSGGDDVAA